MMRVILGVVLTLVVLVAIAAGFIQFGMFNVAASEPHWRATQLVLQTVRVRSIRTHAAGIVPPGNLGSQARVIRGAAHFSEHCAVCHSAPGVEAEDMANGMNPKPPELTHAASHLSAGELFWIVKNGIKMTGMPAWSDHGDDELWDTVAFLGKLPGMSERDYRDLVAAIQAASGQAHGSTSIDADGEGPHQHGDTSASRRP